MQVRFVLLNESKSGKPKMNIQSGLCNAYENEIRSMESWYLLEHKYLLNGGLVCISQGAVYLEIVNSKFNIFLPSYWCIGYCVRGLYRQDRHSYIFKSLCIFVRSTPLSTFWIEAVVHLYTIQIQEMQGNILMKPFLMHWRHLVLAKQ